MNFLTLIDYIGTFAFAISGIRLASAKRFDWFGAYVVGFVTAVGGGTIRDLLLDVTPFWMLQSSYLIVTALALGFVILFGRYVIRLNNTFFIFDAIGLGLFAVVGIEKSITYGYPMWVGLIMGTLTGAAGGVLRDTLINEVPLIFRKEIYALACVFGGLVYYLCLYSGLNSTLTQIIGAVSAARLGSDCAFFIDDRPAFASGKGELLEPIELTLAGYRIIIVKPSFGVSTPEAYAGITPRPAGYDLRQLGQLPVNTWKEYIRNDFEATVFQKYPSLTLLKQQLYERGAEFVSMSGSGSAIYGLFKKDREINLDFPDCCVWQGETLI